MDSHDHKHINKDRFADSAGVPWEGRSFEANPFADDDGSANPALVQALAEFRESPLDPRGVFKAFAASRLLIPLLADLGESGQGAHGQTVDKSADLSIVTVETPDGQTGLPVFSSVAAMARWNKTARPVPSDAVRVALAAASEGNTRIVLDPGSETEFVFRRPAIKAMVMQQEWTPAFLSDEVGQAFAAPIDETEPSVLAIYLEAGDANSRLEGAELQISLKLVAGLTQDEVQSLVSRLAEAWSQSELIAESVDSMQLRLIAAE
ncbi:MAG: SseB family protein [Rhodoluna sp.]